MRDRTQEARMRGPQAVRIDLSDDELTELEARARRLLPMRPGQLERRTHDYK